MKRFSSNAGIAIGPILFVLAMLGLLASMMASGGSGSFGSAGTADRVTADIVSQANLIRAKISECQMQFLVNGDVTPGGPCSDQYPCSDTTDGTLVSDLTCPNDPLDSGNERSLWMGLRPAAYPQPTQGFDQWMYMNAGDAGGRCIWTAPTSGPASFKEGLTRAATKFTSQEVSYDSGSNTQKIVVFITRPSGAANSKCTVP